MIHDALFYCRSVLNACDTVDAETVVEIARRDLPVAVNLLSEPNHADNVLVGVALEAGIGSPVLLDNS